MEFNRYEVVEAFQDLKDEKHVYDVGDNYPRKGAVDPDRITELATDKNRRGKPLVKLVTDEVAIEGGAEGDENKDAGKEPKTAGTKAKTTAAGAKKAKDDQDGATDKE